MTKRKDEFNPKIWRDNPGNHFNPYWDRQDDDKRMHERGLENKTRRIMGERQKTGTPGTKLGHIRQVITVSASRAPITLATLKWGSHDND